LVESYKERKTEKCWGFAIVEKFWNFQNLMHRLAASYVPPGAIAGKRVIFGVVRCSGRAGVLLDPISLSS